MMNERSSRSHALFTLILTRTWADAQGRRLRYARLSYKHLPLSFGHACHWPSLPVGPVQHACPLHA